MKNIIIWFGIIIVWAIVFFKLLEMYPNYILLIIDIMVALLAFIILGFFVIKVGKPMVIIDFEKAKKSVINCENLSKLKFNELITKILYTNYSKLKKAKNNPYYINFYNKQYVFSVLKGTCPIDIDIIEKIDKGKISFGVPFAIVISGCGFTKEALLCAEEKGVILWDKKRLVEILDSEKRDEEKPKITKKIIHKTIKNRFFSLEQLDLCFKDEFENLLCDLLKKHYKFMGKKDKFYLFEIEDKLYAVYMLQGKTGEKIEEKEIEETVNEIYSNDYSNAIIITNTFFHQKIIDLAHKLKIDLWNRDVINYMIEKLK